MNKRQTSLFDLNWDIKERIIMLYTINKPSVLAHALWLSTEGTLLEEDAKSIIEQCYPEYFTKTEDMSR